MKHKFIQHVFTVALCSAIFGIMFLLSSAPVRAQEKVLSLLELRDAIQGNDPAKLQELAYSQAPKDATISTLELYYPAIVGGALAVGDLTQVEKVTRAWLKAIPGNQTATGFLFQVLWRGTATQMEEAVRIGEERILSANFPNEKVTTRAQLADLYMNLGEFTKTEKLLTETENLINTELRFYGSAGVRSFWSPFARSKYFHSRCGQQSRRLDFKKAEAFCLQAIAAANEAASSKRMVNPFAQNVLASMQLQIYTQLADAYTKMARYYDAEVSIKNANTILLNSKGDQSVERVWVLQSQLELATAKKDTAQINTVIAAIRKAAQQSKLTGGSAGGLLAWQYGLAARVALENWPAALEILKDIDSSVANSDAHIKSLALNLIPRSLTYLMNNRATESIPMLEAELQKAASYLGAEHPQTALVRGLLAVSQVASSSSTGTTVLPELERAVVTLTAGGASDYFNQTDHPIALRKIFETYIELAGASSNPLYSGRALGIADSLRASSVQSAMNDAAVRAAASTPALAELVRRDQDAKNELASLYNFISNRAGEVEAKRLEGVIAQMRTRITELEKSRVSLGAEITKQFADYSRLTNPAPPTLADIGAKLSVGEALLTLLPTDSAVYAWAVTNDTNGQTKQQFVKVGMGKAELASLIKRLRASLDVAGLPANRMPAFDSSASQELYRRLLAPVQQGLQGKTSLIVAAGGALGQIPFAVLQTAGNDSWLIKQAAITHVPSVAAWLSMRALPHTAAAQPMMAWGDPLFNIALANTNAAKGDVRKVVLTRASTSVDLEKEDPRSAIKYASIPSLPETKDELLAIAKTLGADANKDLLLGSAATRESVLTQNKNGELAKRRVVAFATHGLMAGDLPNLTQPALAMAGTKDDDKNVLAPLLTLEDVLTLKLNADWVVLSACNTAAADGKAEEALSGLARGFFYAGSRSLLVTHWAVDSESAMTLTTETFKNYQSKPSEAKAESLRQAMLKVMNDPQTAHPTFWAPYALVGDGAR